MNKNKLIVSIAAFAIMIIVMFSALLLTDNKDLQEYVVKETLDTVTEVIVSNKTQELADETIEATENNEDLSTTEVIESSEEEEQAITDEGALENDAVVEQENISYDGDNSGNGTSLLGAYQGITYYSQADSRWANVMFSSIGNTSQTIKSSGCGPTSAAMVVSSSRGAILPTTMAQLAVDNGYRTANSGTAWAFFPFVADYFGFNEYHSTSSFDTAMNYLNQKNENGNSKYYIIVSCGSGLFTSGGHYIVLVADSNGTIQVYDPYLYSGKFDTASRRNAGAIVSGNSVFVSESSFKTYANYRNFWIFSNDNGTGNTNTSTSSVSYTRYVATQSSNLRVRNEPNGAIISSLAKGTVVTVYETSGAWSRIGTNRWVSTAYLSASPVTTTKKTVTGYTTGTYKTIANIHVRTGAGTNYSAKTYKQLSSNARTQNKRLGNAYYNGYRKGVTCTVTKVSGNWGLTKSGWICLSYCSKI